MDIEKNYRWTRKNALYRADLQGSGVSGRDKKGKSDKFWLIFNYSKVVWDINTKFSPVSVLIGF